MNDIVLFRDDKDIQYTGRLIETFKRALADFSKLVLPGEDGEFIPPSDWYPVFKRWATEACVCALAGVPSNKLKKLCKMNEELDELYVLWRDGRDFVCMQQQDYLPEKIWTFYARSMMKLSESAGNNTEAEESNPLKHLPDEALKERLKHLLKNRVLD
jgi:hypothetical protein